MATIYYEKDANLDMLKGKKIAVIGYGSQGHAHALNLQDSGCDVRVGLYKGSKSWARAGKDGRGGKEAGEAAAEADMVMMLVPDTAMATVYAESVAPHMTAGKMLMFAHGFAIHYGQIVPPEDVDVTMVAPKAPGHRVRAIFPEGQGVPGLLAVYQDATGNAQALGLADAKGIGCTRAGVIETTFAEETETDLFGEQAVLCGGLSALIKAGFETLVEAGYQPEIAYFECLNEMKLIVDLVYQGGLSYMRYSISDTAEHGDYTGGPRIVTDATRAEMKRMLAEIQDGTYARNWILENQTGRPSFNLIRKREQNALIERVGKQLRGMMSWLDAK